MRLYRKIEEKLSQWINTKKGLLVYGPRQVGKTYILKTFISEHFKNYYYINLLENVDAIETIIKSKDSKDFLLRLSALTDVVINNGDCIFIDEIQEYYTYLSKHKEITKYFDLLTGIKFIVEEQQYRIIYSGSLLRLEMENVISNPVGYVLPLEMFPLDFEEFLIANNINKELITIAKESFDKRQEVPDYIHEKFMELFKKYLLVGGMPDAVSEYIDNNSFTAVENAHKTISYFVNNDITKYALDNEKLKIKEIYKLIPTELNNISKRFIISHIPNHNKNENEILSFSWLSNLGVTIPVYCVDEPVIPLITSSKRNQLKLFIEDVGLFTYLIVNSQIKAKILDSNFSLNYGSIYETVAAQLLRCHGFENLYYYNNKKYGEVDFIIEYEGKVLPIEIKSGKDYERHRAITNILEIKNYNIDYGIVFYNGNYIKKDKIDYFPIYLLEFLRNN